MYHPRCEKLGTSPLSHGLRHLSFAVGSREKVDELTSQIAADGYDVLRRPRVTGDGATTKVLYLITTATNSKLQYNGGTL